MIRIRTYLYKITFVLIFISTPEMGLAQLTMGADGLALGQATTALQNNNWAIFSNPATINNEQKGISFFSLRNYGFTELTDIAASGSLPTRYGNVAFGFHRYGGDLFNETRIRIGYANYWNDLKYGIALNYNHISQASPYGSGGAVGLDVGLAARIAEGLWLGAKATNLNQPDYNFAANEESLSRELAIGLSYDLDENALFLFDVVKDVRFPVAYRGGIEVKVVENLKGRVGVTTEPNTYSFGVGYEATLWEANLVFQRHETLGYSPGIGLNFFF
ncbi:MAG: hypothetical protein JJ892_06675 [Balneola sp.]|nr:hypothetical protein [Balneola sp.]MBO6711755.1 hypothetical protein [Balneola sp.]MBO6799949.1 hypothetical protein [Balneola sp.]MBO6871194.1 hypothetical protein [Balneola sp.]